MHKPLGCQTYILGNKKNIISFMITIVIAITMLGLSKSTIMNIEDEHRLYYLAGKYYTLVSTIDREFIDPAFVEKAAALNEVAHAYYINVDYLPLYSLTGYWGSKLIYIERSGIEQVMKGMGIVYPLENIPLEDTGQVISAKRVAQNLKLVKGQKIQENVDLIYYDSFESILPLNFTPITATQKTTASLFIPKEGQLKEMNQALREILPKSYRIYDDCKYEAHDLSFVGGTYATFNIIVILITLASSIATGVSTYVHYKGRKEEVNVLKAIGYCEQAILLRVTKEILVIIGIGTCLGIGTLCLVIYLSNCWITYPNTYMPFRVDARVLFSIGVIPLCMLTFSLTPTWLLLKTAD